MAHRGPPVENREVYESIPETSFAKGDSPGHDIPGFGHRARANEDIDEESKDATAAYDYFSGKAFKEGASVPGGPRGLKGRTEFTSTGTRSGTRQDTHRSGSMRQMDSFASKNNAFETPVQRLTRLRGEVEEMQDYVQALSKHRGADEVDEDAKLALLQESKRYFESDPVALFSELGSLQKQIQCVLADDRLQNFLATTETTTGRKSQFDSVVKHLEEVSTTLCTTQDKKVEKKRQLDGNEGQFSYELYCVPSLKPLVEGSRLMTLEKRLSELELHVGVGPRKHVSLPFDDLNSGLADVAHRLAQLDSDRMEALSQRMTKLNNELDALQRRRERISGSTNNVEDQNVQQLYEISDRWRHATAALPMVIRRLRALKALHQEAASVSTRLNVLEAQQGDLAKLLETTAVNFDTLQDNISNNMAWAKSMVVELQEKMGSAGIS